MKLKASELKPGRELDYLIEQHLFKNNERNCVPEYSEDLNDAWEVLEKFIPREGESYYSNRIGIILINGKWFCTNSLHGITVMDMEIDSRDNKDKTSVFSEHGAFFVGTSRASLSICVAALYYLGLVE